MFSVVPSTIRDPARFFEQPPAGFDGPFDWGYLRGAFPRNVMPMDFDGVVELNHFYLLFETKGGLSTPVPIGQKRTLETVIDNGNWSVFVIWGKSEPLRWEFHTPIITGDAIQFPHRIISRPDLQAKQAIYELSRRWAGFVDSREPDAWIRAQCAAHDFFRRGVPAGTRLPRRGVPLLGAVA